MKVKPVSRVVLTSCVVAVSAFLVFCCSGPDQRTAAEPTVSVGIQMSPAMALVMVAKEKGLFDQQGIRVDIKEFTAGKFALQAFLAGSLDFAVAGEVPCTLATLQGNQFVILSQVVEKTINEVRVVARPDRDPTPSALDYFRKEKRKLATSLGGGPEFFTWSFLRKLGLTTNDVEIVSQKPEDMPAALAAGSVNAIAVFDPFAWLAERQLGGKAIVFTDPDVYSELYVVTAKKEFLDTHPAIAEKLLRGLVSAGEYIARHPEDSRAVVAKYTKLEPEVVEAVWGSFVFKPALTPTLLEYQNRQAQWAKETGAMPPNTPVPDFRRAILDNPLRRIAPDAVKLP